MKNLRTELILPSIILFGIMMVSSLVVQVSGQDGYVFEFRDNFESGDFSNWSGTNEGPKATVTRVKSKPYSGRYCARFASDGSAVYCYNFFDEDVIYIGYYIRVGPSGITVDNASVFFCALMEWESGQPFFFFGWRRVAGEIRWTVVSKNYGVWESTIINGSRPSLNQWYQVYTRYMPVVGFLEIYVDENLLHQGELWIEEGRPYRVGEMAVGIVSSFNCKTVKAYVDDFYMVGGWE